MIDKALRHLQHDIYCFATGFPEPATLRNQLFGPQTEPDSSCEALEHQKVLPFRVYAGDFGLRIFTYDLQGPHFLVRRNGIRTRLAAS